MLSILQKWVHELRWVIRTIKVDCNVWRTLRSPSVVASWLSNRPVSSYRPMLCWPQRMDGSFMIWLIHQREQTMHGLNTLATHGSCWVSVLWSIIAYLFGYNQAFYHANNLSCMPDQACLLVKRRENGDQQPRDTQQPIRKWDQPVGRLSKLF